MPPAPTLYAKNDLPRRGSGRKLPPLIGGNLALDFVNTIDRHGDARTTDTLMPGYSNLLDWSEHAGIVSPEDAHRMQLVASRNARDAAAIRQRAIALREALYAMLPIHSGGDVFSDSARELMRFAEGVPQRHPEPERSGGEESPGEAGVGGCHGPASPGDSSHARNDEHRWLLAEAHQTRVALVNDEIQRAFAARTLENADEGFRWVWIDARALDRPLFEVSLAAESLLTGSRLGRVRQCDAPDCERVFLDTSRNGLRRYCTAGGCGTRERVRNFRERQRNPV